MHEGAGSCPESDETFGLVEPDGGDIGVDDRVELDAGGSRTGWPS